MKARNRPHLISVELRSVSEDGFGGEIESWMPAFQEYAAVHYGSGSEQRSAAQQSASQAATFDLLNNSRTREISVVDSRIGFDGGIWNITSVHGLGLNEGIRITAVRVAQ